MTRDLAFVAGFSELFEPTSPCFKTRARAFERKKIRVRLGFEESCDMLKDFRRYFSMLWNCNS